MTPSSADNTLLAIKLLQELQLLEQDRKTATDRYMLQGTHGVKSRPDHSMAIYGPWLSWISGAVLLVAAVGMKSVMPALMGLMIIAVGIWNYRVLKINAAGLAQEEARFAQRRRQLEDQLAALQAEE
jgi:hypothetical protein